MADKLGFLEGFFDPGAREVDRYKQKLQAKADQGNELGGAEQILAEEHLRQYPNTDWSGIPGYEGVQQKYNKKLLDQGGHLFRAKKDEKGEVTGYTPKKGAKEKLEHDKMWNPVKMGAKGPERLFGQKLKDHIMEQIQLKRQQGIATTDKEANFEKKYLGIKDSKTGPSSAKDWEQLLKMAKDSEMADRISAMSKMAQEKNEEFDVNSVKDIPITFEESMQSIGKALEFRYPNMDKEKIADVVNKYSDKTGPKWIDSLGISLPDEITGPEQAYQFLIDSGADPIEAKEWIRERAE